MVLAIGDFTLKGVDEGLQHGGDFFGILDEWSRCLVSCDSLVDIELGAKFAAGAFAVS